jgi:threonine dehydrogenase-like Zn-dependent dehydrogenase
MSKTMQAIAVLPGARELRLVAQEVPEARRPTEVKLRMLEVGVCGTDREISAFEYGTPPEGSDRLVIGHESLGEVVEVGSAVSRVRPGDLVVPMVRRPCPHAHCLPCRSGRQDFCTTGDFRERGIKQADGFMTEYVVDDETYMNPIPRELRDVAVLVEPLTIAEKALLQIESIQQRLPWRCGHAGSEGFGHCHKALVLGAGPVGLLGALALSARGFDTWVFSREVASHWKAKLVGGFGGHFASARDGNLAAWSERAGRFDVVYEAAGVSRLAFEAAHQLAANGVFVFTGVPAIKGPAEVDTDRLMRSIVLQNQALIGSVNAGRDAFERAVQDLGVFLERWPEAVRSLISGRFPVDAYRELLLGESTGIKNVIRFDGNAA